MEKPLDHDKLQQIAEELWNDPQLGSIAQVERSVQTRYLPNGLKYQLKMLITCDPLQFVPEKKE